MKEDQKIDLQLEYLSISHSKEISDSNTLIRPKTADMSEDIANIENIYVEVLGSDLPEPQKIELAQLIERVWPTLQISEVLLS